MSIELTDSEESLTDSTAMAAFLTALLGLILPIIPAIVALFLAHKANKKIKSANGLVGGMGFVYGAQVLAILNFFIIGGVAAAAIYLSS